ncbi:RDD family protein [bacterium]|jgi:uncharacterized RDD family membrane protein YckC|nr:RDD family protein [bacterium]
MEPEPIQQKEKQKDTGPDLAPLSLRSLAYLIDWILIAISSTILGLLYIFTLGFVLLHIPLVGPLLNQFIFQLLYALVFILYHAYFESDEDQATVGKKLCGLKVIRGNASRKLSFGDAFSRGGAKLLSKILFLLGFVMAFLRPDKKALHDLIMNTDVVQIDEPHPKIKEVFSRFSL